MRELSEETLVVFVSDSHIGGDPGCDGFESPEELESLFEELAAYENPVELVLAGDFFDLLLIGEPPPQTNRARLTIERKEYKKMFDSLRRFASRENHRVIYLPGNHDAEVWWNPQVRETLRREGLVEEFSLSYLASVGGFTIYSEHGNQFDIPNYVEDYKERLDTPIGHHVVTDFTRQVAPIGQVTRHLDLSQLKNIYPLGAIPQWIASKYFYDVLERALAFLLVPFVLVYIGYRAVALYLDIERRLSLSFSQSYLTLPRVHDAFSDFAGFLLASLVLFALILFVLRRGVRRLVSNLYPWRSVGERTTSQRQAIEEAVRENKPMPMLRGEHDPIDVFVSGHTHSPSLTAVERKDGREAVVVNSGCWLRQLRPVGSWLRWPPVFVPRFVLTHVRVFLRGSVLRVELWERPKPAAESLMKVEQLASLGKRPKQPPADAKPRVISAREIPAPDQR